MSSSPFVLAPDNCSCSYYDVGASVANSPICNGLLLFMTLLEGFINGRCDIVDPCERINGRDTIDEEYDFIVVGSGAAGPVVAARLAENENFKVLLIEAGNIDPVPSRLPGFYRNYWHNEEVDWKYNTVPGDYCLETGGKGCIWPRGKALGGSTLYNGMMFHRGHPADYDDWVDFGAEGWSYEEILPYFYKIEGNKQIGDLVDSTYHSSNGTMPVQQYRHTPDFVYDLMTAVNQSGFNLIDDMNNPTTPSGFTIAQAFNSNGQRYTPARAYLGPYSQKENLHVLLNAHVTKVLIEGTKAYGVEYVKDGETKTVQTCKEVILSAGALNTPQILMLSGIGPKDNLEQLDIPVVADLPVGQNLRNHYGMTLYFILETEFNTQTLDWAVASEYLLERQGPMTSTGITQFTGLLYSSLANVTKLQPDLQFFFNGYYAECSAQGVVGELVNDSGKNISVNVVDLLPESTGYLVLNSSDPFDSPLFYPEYFVEESDMTVVKDGALYIRDLLESDVMKTKYGARLDTSYTHVCNETGEEWSDEWLECIARYYTDAQNHQIGSAAIGLVIDTDLKVYDVSGLRVIDASSMPTQVTGNCQAAIMVIAEKGADLIKAEWA